MSSISGRRTGPSILIELLANLTPFLLGSIVVSGLGYALSYFTSVAWWLPLLILYVTAPLSLWRPFETMMISFLTNVHKAQGADLAKIVGSLNRANLRHDFPIRRWILTVEEGNHLNASTSGRHVLTLTRTALQLPEPLLDAVLAHELAHQAGGDTIIKAFRWWFLIPVQLVTKVLRISAWGAVAFSFLGILQVVVAAALTVLLYGLTIPILAVLPLNAFVERRNELAADRYAANAGFREELVMLLKGFERPQTVSTSLWSRVTSTHPTIQTRLNALEDN